MDQANLLDFIAEAWAKLPDIPNYPKRLIMHPLTAEKLLRHFLAVDVSVLSVCPPDTVYVTHEDFLSPEDAR